MGGARRAVEFGKASKPAVDRHAHPVQGQRGLGNRGGEHDAAATVSIAADRGALGGGFDLAVERMDRGVRQARRKPLAHPLDLAHTGQEGEDVARLPAPRGHHRASHPVLDRLRSIAAKPLDFQREASSLALDDRRSIAQQPGKARAVDGGRHHQHAQVFAQHGAGLERQGQPEVAV